MKLKNFIIKIIVLAVVIAILLIPAINPFLSADRKVAVSNQLSQTFGSLAGNRGILTIPKLVTILAMIACVWLVSAIVSFILHRVNNCRKTASSVVTLFISLVKYAAVLVAIIWGLSILGANITAIFASVGVISLIVGFGAQSLIEDTITGIFLIFENHFKVGDFIVLDDFRGKVVKIGIRTVTLEDAGGNLKVVNNSDIRNFQNRSENLSLAICDVGISYDADVRKVEKVLQEAFETMYENNKDVFEAVPTYMGVEGLDASAVTLRVTVQTKEVNFFAARRRLNRELKILFDANNIEIPFTQVVLHQGS